MIHFTMILTSWCADLPHLREVLEHLEVFLV